MRSPISSRNSSRQALFKEAPDDSSAREEYISAFPLSRLRKLFNPALQSVHVEEIKRSVTSATVYRLTLDNGSNSEAYPATLIAKRIAPDWGEDPLGHRREYEFYRQWADRIGTGLPRVFYAGPEPDTDYGLILLEDVGKTHRFSAPDHLWSPDELRQALRAYAQLHVQGYAIIDRHQIPDWLFPRYEERVSDRAADLPEMIGYLAEAGVYPPLRGVEHLVARAIGDIQTLTPRPATLLHNDVAPQNIGLGQGNLTYPNVVLVDWEMVGWGLPEMDLAYLFMQPFGNTRNVDRFQMLEVYWAERQRLEGVIPPRDDRIALQHYADTVFALWLVPVAYERCRNPFPAGSAPRLYWESMFIVLGERLQALIATWI